MRRRKQLPVDYPASLLLRRKRQWIRRRFLLLIPPVTILFEAAGRAVVGSRHDHSGTPPREELIARLRRAQDLGADLPKLAVTPRSPADVLTLLSATEEMARRWADRPIITMSMAADGVVSRLCGEIFGSAMTFGAAGQTSAPGQLPVEELRLVLDILHRSRPASG